MVEVEAKVFNALKYYNTSELIKLKIAIKEELGKRKFESISDLEEVLKDEVGKT